MILLLAFVLWIVPAMAYAAVAVDVASSSSCEGCTGLSWNLNITAGGANLMVVVGASIDGGSGQTVSSTSYNSVTCTAITSTSNVRAYTAAQRCMAPATGLHGANITASASTNIVGGAIAMTGVDQTTPLGTPVTGADLFNTPISVTVPASGLSLDVATNSLTTGTCDTLTAQSGQTQQWNVCTTPSIEMQGVASTRSTSGAHAWSGPNGYQSQIGLPINAAASGGASLVRHKVVSQ